MKQNLKFKTVFTFVFASVFMFLACINIFAIDPQQKKSQVNIPIAMALDDGYTYPTIVSITSIMENASRDTYYDFYIMHPSNFKTDNKNKIMSLTKKYNKCKIKFINMEKAYSSAYDKGHITTPAYYRLSLPDKLPNIDKILWLDGDTLIFKDLREMYNLDMRGLYCRGLLDDYPHRLSKFGIKCDKYICSGVMVMNLKDMRRDRVVQKFNKFIKANNSKLAQHDQTVINYVCRGKIGKLPPRFGMFNYYSQRNDWKKYCKNGYTQKEMENAFDNLSIIHCICKPWNNPKVAFGRHWWDYARKTAFYKDICKKYPASRRK